MSHASEVEQIQSTGTAAALPAEIVMPKFRELTRSQICWMLGSSTFLGTLVYFAWMLDPRFGVMVASFGIGWNVQEYVLCLQEAVSRSAKLAWLARLAVVAVVAGGLWLFMERSGVGGARPVIMLVGVISAVNICLGRSARANGYAADWRRFSG